MSDLVYAVVLVVFGLSLFTMGKSIGFSDGWKEAKNFIYATLDTLPDSEIVRIVREIANEQN